MIKHLDLARDIGLIFERLNRLSKHEIITEIITVKLRLLGLLSVLKNWHQGFFTNNYNKIISNWVTLWVAVREKQKIPQFYRILFFVFEMHHFFFKINKLLNELQWLLLHGMLSPTVSNCAPATSFFPAIPSWCFFQVIHSTKTT